MEHKYSKKSFSDLWKTTKPKRANMKYTRTFIFELNSILLLFSSFKFNYIVIQTFYQNILNFCQVISVQYQFNFDFDYLENIEGTHQDKTLRHQFLMSLPTVYDYVI